MEAYLCWILVLSESIFVAEDDSHCPSFSNQSRKTTSWTGMLPSVTFGRNIKNELWGTLFLHWNARLYRCGHGEKGQHAGNAWRCKVTPRLQSHSSTTGHELDQLSETQISPQWRRGYNVLSLWELEPSDTSICSLIRLVAQSQAHAE